MDWLNVREIMVGIQQAISFTGTLIIFSGVLLGLIQYLYYIFTGQIVSHGDAINTIRLHLGRILILGLEFIIAADLIGTTTAPDYYSVGILAVIVIIRTMLSFTLNRDIAALSKEN